MRLYTDTLEAIDCTAKYVNGVRLFTYFARPFQTRAMPIPRAGTGLAHRKQGDVDLSRAIKWLFIVLAALVGVVIAVVGFVAATFDPNDHKARIVELVKHNTGRSLVLEGDIALSLFPVIGAKLGRASLSEPNSSKPFANIESAFVAVKFWPLLSKQVVVDAIDLQGLHLTVVRDRSGRMNFDDLLGGDSASVQSGAKTPEKSAAPGASAPKSGAPESGSAGSGAADSAAAVRVDITRVDISRADVTFSDQATGAQYRFSNLDLETGRIASGIATPVELSATIASNKDKARIATRLKTKLSFDLARQVYGLDKLDLSAKGDYGDITALDAHVKGSLEVRMDTGEYVASALAARASGKRPSGNFDLKLDAPKLALTRDKVEGGKIALDASSSDADGKLIAKITLDRLSGAYSAVKAEPLAADIALQGAGRAYTAQLRGTLSANLDKKTAAMNFSGTVDQSNVQGHVVVTRFSPLAFTFDLAADQLDVDRLLGHSSPRQASAGAGGPSSPGPSPATPASAGPTPAAPAPAAKHAQSASDAGGDAIDLSALKGLDAAGKVRIGKLIAHNVRSEDVRATIKASNGRLEVAPLSARLYQGTLAGSLSVQAAKAPVFALRQTLTGVAVGPLLRDAAQIDTLEGRGTVRADLSARGATVQALKKALNGTASVNLSDGSVKGIDIAGAIRSVRSKLDELRGKSVRSSNKSEKTDFTELKASFKLTNSVAHNDDLLLKSPLLRLEGAGDIDIGEERLDYLLKATLVATSKGQGGRDIDEVAGITVPVQLTGALSSPQWSIDFAGVAASLAQKKLQDEIQQRITGSSQKHESRRSLEDALKRGLEGLFRR